MLELVKLGNYQLLNILVNQNGLQDLTRWMLCSDESIRFLCAQICHLLYKDSKPVQNIFVAVNGHMKLVQMLLWSSKNEKELDEILRFTEDLVIDQQSKVRKKIRDLFRQAMLRKVLDQIERETSSMGIKMRIKQLKLKIAQVNI